jgi:hypothetical protein
VETERIGAGLKVHAAVRDTTIEQRVGVAPHVEQTADVPPSSNGTYMKLVIVLPAFMYFTRLCHEQ